MSGKSTGENFEVDIKNWREADAIHMWRYYNARGFIEPGDEVIDVGCGHGYGTDILSRSLAKSVVGYDYDERVLENRAKKLYGPRFEYRNFEKDELPECDYTVCIEVIEHMEDPVKFAQKLKDSARRILFVSTPIVPMTGENKFHKNEFSVDDVHRLFRDKEWEIFKWASLGGEDGLFLFYRKSWRESL